MDRADPRGWSQAELTVFLRKLAHGDPPSQEALMARLVDELRSLARGLFRSRPAMHSVQPTMLVNEVYLKLFGRAGLDVRDRQHFLAVAACAMRQVLVDHARAGRRVKRGGGRALVTLDEKLVGRAGPELDVLDLDQALEELGQLDARQARVVELRYFAGLEVDEVAATLAVSRTTVEREWRAARAWLGKRLERGHSG